MENKQEEKKYLNVLRIFAMYLVMLNHRPIYTYALNSSNNIESIISIFIAIIIKCGPPLFFMISGILLLDKEENLIYIFKHRMLKIIVIMVLCAIWQNKTNITLMNTVYSLCFKLNWYFYHYIAYLLILPFLRKMVKCLDWYSKWYLYFLLVGYYLIAWIINTVGNIDTLFRGLFQGIIDNGPGSLWFIIFPLLGYLLVSNYNSIVGYIKVWLLILSLISVNCGIYLSFLATIKNDNDSFEKNNQYSIIFIIQMILIFFIFFNSHIKNISFFDKYVSIGSKSIFGIFVIETNTGYTEKVCRIFIKIFGEFIPQYLCYLIGTLIALIIGTSFISFIKIAIKCKIPIFLHLKGGRK